MGRATRGWNTAPADNLCQCHHKSFVENFHFCNSGVERKEWSKICGVGLFSHPKLLFGKARPGRREPNMIGAVARTNMSLLFGEFLQCVILSTNLGTHMPL